MQLMRKFRHDNPNHLNQNNQHQSYNTYEKGECSNSQPSVITTQEQKVNPNNCQNTKQNQAQPINTYQQGQNVLWLKPIIKRKKGKFANKWFGPYEIKTVYPNGTVDLYETTGLTVRVNINKLRPYAMEEGITEQFPGVFLSIVGNNKSVDQTLNLSNQTKTNIKCSIKRKTPNEQQSCTYCNILYKGQACFKNMNTDSRTQTTTKQFGQMLQQIFKIEDINQYHKGQEVLWLKVMENEIKDEWVGPAIVKTIYPNKMMKLINSNGKEFLIPV